MRIVIYQILNSLNEKIIGPSIRTVGKRLYEIGKRIQGQQLSQDRVTPSLRKLVYDGKEPYLQDTQFVAPNATILGDVIIGQNSSVWYGATIIGSSPIRIGNNSIIQDRVHISRATNIGDNVFVGPNSIIQGSNLHNRAFVSMGATIRHSTIHSGGFVAAGAVIADNIQVKQGQIWAGNPGKFLRNITPLEREVLKEHLDQMQELASIHSQQTQKTVRQIIEGRQVFNDAGDFEQFMKNNTLFPMTSDDIQFFEQRILMKNDLIFPQASNDYEPYRFQNKHLPEKFKIGQNQQQFAQVALKLKLKQSFNDKKPWTTPY